MAAPKRGTDRRAQEEQRPRSGSLQRGHPQRTQPSDLLAAANGNREGEVADARTNRPPEIEVRRPPALAPHRDGIRDAEAESVPEPGALLSERFPRREAGGRFEDHEPAASHLALDRVVP